MTTEAGWYYAEGDPPGSVRRWNGTEWIGFPIMQPTAEGSTPGSTVGVKPFRPHAGQVGLTTIAVIVQLGLLATAAANLFYGVSLLQVAPYVTDFTQDGPDFVDQLPSGLATRFGLSALASQLLTFFTGVMFLIWFTLAYRNMSLWHRNRRAGYWPVLAWIVPFISLIRPMTMMMELAENSPRPDKRKDVSPIPVMVWWILWLLTQFGVMFFLTRDLDALASSLLTGLGTVNLLSVVSAGLAIWIVQQITDAQQGRRVPSPAQRELMRQEAEVAAFQRSQSADVTF